MRQYLALGIITTLVATACGTKSSSSSDSPATDTTTVKGQAFGTLNLTQKTNAATPKGFKKSSSLALDDSDVCGTTFPAVSNVRPDGYYSCLAAFDIRDRFFQRGPTMITNRLESVDGRLNGYVGRLANYSIPCLDPTHTVATEEVVSSVGSETLKTVPAYALTENSIATTFADGHSLDLGRTYYYSCVDAFDNHKVLLGKKENAWYLGEIQTAASGASTPSIKTFMKLDADENLEVLFGIAGSALGNSTLANPESGGYSAVNGSGNVYQYSAGFAQFVVRPLENIIGASAVMNYACEQRLIMNDKAVYVEVNSNNYGSCFSGDIWTADSGYSGPAHDAARLNVKGCLKVSGSLPEPQADLSLCESSGLLVANEAGNGYEDPFAKYGILKLSTNTTTPPTGGFALRAYHGTRLAPNLGTGTNELQLISYPPDSIVEIDDYATSSFAFVKTSTSSDSDAGSISAACNAAAATRTVSYSQSSEFVVQSWVDQAQAQVSAGAEAVSTDAAIAQLNQALANTGDAAPLVKIRIARSLGASFRAISSGTVTVKYGDTTLGSATLDQTDLPSDKGYTDLTINFTSIPTATASGKFTVEYSGQTLLSCNNATSTTRKVNSHMGLASLKFFIKSETSSDSP